MNAPKKIKTLRAAQAIKKRINNLFALSGIVNALKQTFYN